MDRSARDRGARRERDQRLNPSRELDDPVRPEPRLVGPPVRGPRWLASVCGIVVAIVLAEVAVRISGPTMCIDRTGVLLDADPRVGWTFTPGLTLTLRSCTPGERWRVPLSVNSRGLADLERPYAKRPGEVRLLLLGNQLIDGITMAHDDRLANRLSSMADRRRGARLTVVNGAIDGYATREELRWLREEGVRYSPDVVVLVVDTGRDLRATVSPPGVRSVPAGFPPHSFLLDVSGFARWLAGRPAVRPADPVEIGEPRPLLTAEESRTALLRNRELVAEIAAASRAAGSGFAVVAGRGCEDSGPSGTEFCTGLSGTTPCRSLDEALDHLGESGRRCVDGGRRWSRDALFLASHTIWNLLAEAGLWPSSVVKGWRL
jgi:hypothetical protein